MGRSVAVGLVFVWLAALGNISASQDATPEPNVLLRAPLTDSERVSVTRTPDRILVSISGPSVLLYFSGSPSAPTLEGLQVWLLKRDGTAVQRQPGIVRGAARSSANAGSRSVGLRFDPAPAADLAAVVIQAHGKLSVHDIGAK
jgi:hypothetical protein